LIDRQTYHQLLLDDKRLKDQPVEELQAFARRFPWCAAAHILLAKKYQQLDHSSFEPQRNLAALHAGDREQLFFYLHPAEQPATPSEVVNGTGTATPGEPPVEREMEAKPEPSPEESGTEMPSTAADQLEETLQQLQQLKAEAQEKKEDAAEETPSPANEAEDQPAPPEKEPESKPKAGEPPAAPVSEREQEPEAIEKPPTDFKAQKHSFKDWLHHFRHVSEKPAGEPKQSEQPTGKNRETTVPEALTFHKPYNIEKALGEPEEASQPKPATQRLSPDEPVSKRKAATGVQPPSKPEETGNLEAVKKRAKQSISEDDELISDTLARIYVAQQKYDKAIQVYERLRLKYPDKSGYFAAKIDELKNKL